VQYYGMQAPAARARTREATSLFHIGPAGVPFARAVRHVGAQGTDVIQVFGGRGGECGGREDIDAGELGVTSPEVTWPIDPAGG
jgi:hypothetical protein